MTFEGWYRAGALVQWLKLPAGNVGYRVFESHSGLHVSKKQNVSSPLTGNDSILGRGAMGGNQLPVT